MNSADWLHVPLACRQPSEGRHQCPSTSIPTADTRRTHCHLHGILDLVRVAKDDELQRRRGEIRIFTTGGRQQDDTGTRYDQFGHSVSLALSAVFCLACGYRRSAVGGGLKGEGRMRPSKFKAAVSGTIDSLCATKPSPSGTNVDQQAQVHRSRSVVVRAKGLHQISTTWVGSTRALSPAQIIASHISAGLVKSTAGVSSSVAMSSRSEHARIH